MSFAEPVQHNLHDEWVEAEMAADAHRYLWVIDRGLLPECLEIFHHVSTGRQKEGQQQDLAGPACDALGDSGRDGRFGQFQIGGCDDRIVRRLPDHFGQLDQFRIRLRPSTAVCDEQHGRPLGIIREGVRSR